MNSKGLLYVTFFAIFCVTWALENKIAIMITPKNVLELREMSKPCAEKSGVDVKILSKVLDWTIPNDKPTKSFIYCLCINTGYTETNGHLIIEKMLTHKLLNGTQEEYINELNECNKINRETNIDTLFDIAYMVRPENVLEVREMAKPCAEKSGVDVSILQKVLNWTIPNDKPTKSFIYCLCFNTGYTDTDGHLIINKMLTHKLLNGTQEEYINGLKECNKIIRESNIDTFYDVNTCVYDNFVMSIK